MFSREHTSLIYPKDAHGKFFIGMYGVLISYFAGCMIRICILMAPCVCLMVGIVTENIVRRATKSMRLTLIGLRKTEMELEIYDDSVPATKEKLSDEDEKDEYE